MRINIIQTYKLQIEFRQLQRWSMINTDSADSELVVFVVFFLENRIGHFMQIVS